MKFNAALVMDSIQMTFSVWFCCMCNWIYAHTIF